MNNWMSDAQRRIDGQKALEEAERVRQQQETEQVRLAVEQSIQQSYQELLVILNYLEADKKLRDIANQFIRLEPGEKVELSPVRKYQNSSGAVAKPCVGQYLLFTSRPYEYVRRKQTGWTGANQGSGGGHAIYTTEEGVTVDTLNLSVTVTEEFYVPNFSRRNIAPIMGKHILVNETQIPVTSNVSPSVVTLFDEALIKSAQVFVMYQRKPFGVKVHL